MVPRLNILFPAFILLFYCCSDSNTHVEKRSVKDTIATLEPKPEKSKSSTTDLPINLMANSAFSYVSADGDNKENLRLEIHGLDHEELWFYSDGDLYLSVVPGTPVNGISDLIDNMGTKIGSMEIIQTDLIGETEIPEEIELTIGEKKLVLFRNKKS